MKSLWESIKLPAGSSLVVPSKSSWPDALAIGLAKNLPKSSKILINLKIHGHILVADMPYIGIKISAILIDKVKFMQNMR